MTDKEDGTKKPDTEPLDDAALEKYVYVFIKYFIADRLYILSQKPRSYHSSALKLNSMLRRYETYNFKFYQ